MRNFYFAIYLGVVVCGPGLAYGQGALTPEAGPAPIFKALDQLEPRTPIPSLPFTITEAGSYYLISNLIATAGFAADGITIAADDVTIDLYGFSLVGAPGSLSGIVASGARRNISIDNGVIKLWDASGIDIRTATNSRIRRIRFADNNYAVRAGDASIVRKCTATGSMSLGVEVARGSEVHGCVVNSTSAGPGFLLQDGALITECVAYSNAHAGIVASNGCSVADCVSSDNQHGFLLDASRINGCLAADNTSNGITIIAECVVRRNLGVMNVGASLEVQGSGNLIEENLFRDGTGLNVLASNNLIVANATGTNNNIATNNRVGPFDYNVTLPPTNHPWANIAF